LLIAELTAAGRRSRSRARAAHPDAIAAFDDPIRSGVEATELCQRENLAGANAGKAMLQIELNRRDGAIAVLSDLIARFQDDRPPLIAHAREARGQPLEDGTDDK
jgi:hypothetical protein